MKKLLQFFKENQNEFGISYQTFKKYLLNNLDMFNNTIKIVKNEKRKSYFITDEKKFLEIFRA